MAIVATKDPHICWLCQVGCALQVNSGQVQPWCFFFGHCHMSFSGLLGEIQHRRQTHFTLTVVEFLSRDWAGRCAQINPKRKESRGCEKSRRRPMCQ